MACLGDTCRVAFATLFATAGIIAVAAVRAVRAGTVQIGFDGWSSQYDYYVDASSTNLRPVGYCERFGLELEPPKGTVLHPSIHQSIHPSIHHGLQRTLITDSSRPDVVDLCVPLFVNM